MLTQDRLSFGCQAVEQGAHLATEESQSAISPHDLGRAQKTDA